MSDRDPLHQEVDALRDENRALRAAGTSLRDAARKVDALMGCGGEEQAVQALYGACLVWDAAITSSEGIPDDGSKEAALAFLADKRGESIQQVIRDAITAPSPTEAAGEEVDDPCGPRDAMRYPNLIDQRFHSLERWREGVDRDIEYIQVNSKSIDTDFKRRIADLEQRADEDHKVIDVLQIWGVDLQKRLSALEAIPQDSDVSDEMVTAAQIVVWGQVYPSRDVVKRALEAAFRVKRGES